MVLYAISEHMLLNGMVKKWDDILFHGIAGYCITWYGIGGYCTIHYLMVWYHILYEYMILDDMLLNGIYGIMV
jgi:hypothetical protein